MSDETLNDKSQEATFSFRHILEAPLSETQEQKGLSHLDEVALLLRERFNNGKKADVGVMLASATVGVLDHLHQLNDADSIRAIGRLDSFLLGVFGDEYSNRKGAIFAEFAVMKGIRDIIGCGVQMPSAEDDMHGVDLWVDISPDEDGSEMLALQIKYTTRFGDRDGDPQAIFKLLDKPEQQENLKFYLGVKSKDLAELERSIDRVDRYVKIKASKDGVSKYSVAYLALSSHHSWFDKRIGVPNKRLQGFLEEKILNGLVYGEQPKGDKK